MNLHRPHLADIVQELVAPRIHREHYTHRINNTWFGEDHITTVPSLIWQLVNATPSSQGDERSNAGYGSRPTARLEALDTLMLIDHSAARWIRELGHNDPADQVDHTTGLPQLGSGAAACISLLHGLHAGTTICGKTPKPNCCDRHDIERDIRSWWTMARIVTGWDSAAWRPDNTCPMCEVKGGLRVKLAAQSAYCVECRETWDQTSIGLLADHIRRENADERAAAS